MKICRKLSIDDYKKKVEEYGHTFLGLIEKTKREQQRVSFECGKCKSVSEGNIYHMSTVCGKCKCKKYRISEEKVKDTLLLFNHKFVGFEYYEKGGEYKIVFNCGNCGSKRVSALRDIKTKFCRKCFVLPQRSKNELFLVSLIKQKYPFLDIKESDRDLLDGKSIKGDFLELDILLKKDKTPLCAIEWNGYFHFIGDKTREENDKLKIKYMNELNIPLLVIDDYGSQNEDFVSEKFNYVIKKFIERFI